jgi:hypothetical protein|tara:strand:+ start:362 stop:505 length:144 start_codon:yes stop_codon:yes gene_type:complete
MIQNILELLPFVKDGSENIRIAKGCNYLPKNFKEAFTQIKKEIRWQK